MDSPTDTPRNRLPIIGLLGAPGSGKSTVARCFEREHCVVIDADLLAREALDSAKIRDKLVAWWGPQVAPDGQVDRKAVGEVVFADPEQRQKLEGLIHPYVLRRREAIRQEVTGDRASPIVAIVEDCPLLLETGLDAGCDALVFVDTPLAVRRERVLASRGWSPEQLAAREAAQWPLETKRAKSGYTIDNAQDPEAIQRQVQGVLQDIIQAFALAHPARAPRK